MRRLLLLLAPLLPACTTVDHHRVEGWPQLEIVEHYVPHGEMQDRCVRYVGFGMAPEACAEFDLAARKCHIWYSAESLRLKFVREHERLHCAGYDHVGSTAMQQFLTQHQIRQAAASAAAGSSRSSPGVKRYQGE
jgi:hypothetical protein